MMHGVLLVQFAINRTSKIDSLRGRLFGASQDVGDHTAGNRSRVLEPQLICGERGNDSLLIASDLIWKRAPLDPKRDGLGSLIDRIGSGEADRARHDRLGFFWRWGRGVLGSDLRQVRTGVHAEEVTGRVEDIATLRVGAIPLEPR